ncbi:hypothetical protein ACFP3I_20990 [Chryseobacterium arachidis]
MQLEIYDDFSYQLILNWYQKYQEGDIFDIEDPKLYFLFLILSLRLFIRN